VAVHESKPEPDPSVEPRSDDGDAEENAGDFTLEELMRAHRRNVDPEGRRIDRPEDD
jgi:hypothetical protein